MVMVVVMVKYRRINNYGRDAFFLRRALVVPEVVTVQ